MAAGCCWSRHVIARCYDLQRAATLRPLVEPSEDPWDVARLMYGPANA